MPMPIPRKYVDLEQANIIFNFLEKINFDVKRIHVCDYPVEISCGLLYRVVDINNPLTGMWILDKKVHFLYINNILS
jgi:hypothetical protein